jgi:pimeloyl-ACP methyl ester carboxylesterase
MAALPGAAAIALWGGYRRAVHEFRSDQATPLHLPGLVRTLPTDWGQVSYRYVGGSNPGPALVLVHGWGRSADSVWWQLIRVTDRTVVAVDLPGHGRSTMQGRFTFAIAAQAVGQAIADARLTRPILVAHSMGGPVALTAFRQSERRGFAGFVAIATSAYWVRPRHQVMVAVAPYLLAPKSPIVTGAMRAEAKRDPDRAAHVEREYTMRPTRRVLAATAAELRRFDARTWEDLSIPHGVWMVTAEDRVVPPDDQRASARHFGIPTVDLASDHPAAMRAPTEIAKTIERSSRAWTE